ncbi:MAG: hypothetical protein KKI06_05860 [Euryarchaeota archaeon]|nr:hypothetical protein [Euryarchaeota archaeon]MBU4223442.1 hypothetical protein [Euryarchaeota archaeon]MCG2734828.1 hypothetical protein [Candidatus Methanoperedenaceae archaeon]
MTPKFLLITAFSLIGIIFISGCINKEKTKEELGDEIQNIGEAVPKGWNYTIIQNFIGEVIPASGYGKIITQNSEEMPVPHGIWKPAAIVNFVNLNKEIEYYSGVKTDKKYNPSLRLYFYNITQKQEIMEIIDKERIYSWCVPIYFDETKKYIIVTSGCYINSGIFTEEARNYYSPLEKSLKEYFDKYNESIGRSSTIIEKVELSENEKAKLSNLIEDIPEEIKKEFNTKYGAWKDTWDDPNLIIHSNPRMFAQSRQYEEFLSFCREQDKTIWPLLFQKYEQGDELVKMAIIDLTYTEYGSLLDEIRQESTKERYTAEGAYIAPSEEANMMKYIKKLLALI